MLIQLPSRTIENTNHAAQPICTMSSLVSATSLLSLGSQASAMSVDSLDTGGSCLGGTAPGLTLQHQAQLMASIDFPPMLDPAPGDSYDDLWQQGIVYTPPLQRKPWPHGIYARDMAMALIMLSESSAGDDLATHFERIFQGRPFKYATYQTQRAAWQRSTEQERQQIMQQPRTHQGLWTACRGSLHGWQQLPSHKRPQNN